MIWVKYHVKMHLRCALFLFFMLATHPTPPPPTHTHLPLGISFTQDFSRTEVAFSLLIGDGLPGDTKKNRGGGAATRDTLRGLPKFFIVHG